MATLDAPAQWIVENLPQAGCEGVLQVFPEGLAPAGLPLSAGELVYGAYRGEVFLSPLAIFFPVKGVMCRLRWTMIKRVVPDLVLVGQRPAWRFRTTLAVSPLYVFEHDAPPASLQRVVDQLVGRFGPREVEPMTLLPTHLRECVRRPDVPVTEAEGRVAGPVVCPCGSSELELLYIGERGGTVRNPVICVTQVDDGFFLRLSASCPSCDRMHLLLDMDLHGWNGRVCRVEKEALRPRPPYKTWSCPKCQSTRQRISVMVLNDGREFILDEADGMLDGETWPDGFGWFGLSTECARCGTKIESLVDFETM